MLEIAHRDGRAREARWQPRENGPVVQTPNMVIPDVSGLERPAWTQVAVTREPRDAAVVELISAGTWFYADPEREAAAGAGELVVAAPQPGPTSQVQIVDVGSELAIFHDAGGWASNPRNLVPALIEAKTQATEGRLLWAPALGTPADYALWVYLGVDLFDASPLLLAAVRGQALTVDGPLSAEDAGRLLGDGEAWDEEQLRAHNLEAARRELLRIRHAIGAGQLRALVERRIYAAPGTVEILRRFDREHRYLEAATVRNRDGPLPCMTQESLWSPEVESFRRRFRDLYTPPASADVLVLLPCSQRKPYRLSKTHRHFQRALDDSGIRYRCHEVMVTSPLGLVPRELESVHPADAYDVPVTGHWNRDEEAIIREQVAALLDKHPYAHVVSHVDTHTHGILRDLLPDGTIHTAGIHRPSGIEACKALRNELRRIRADDRREGDFKLNVAVRRREDLQALCTYQFGPVAGAALAKDAKVRGKVPFQKLLGPEGQRGITTIDRGLLSLTLDGARIIAEHQTHRVFIPDFSPKKTSTLFAVGVERADPDVRTGDEVVIVHDGPDGIEVRGCGVAQMPGEAMGPLKRGGAVNLRHVT